MNRSIGPTSRSLGLWHGHETRKEVVSSCRESSFVRSTSGGSPLTPSLYFEFGCILGLSGATRRSRGPGKIGL